VAGEIVAAPTALGPITASEVATTMTATTTRVIALIFMPSPRLRTLRPAGFAYGRGA
jgi:hypothetical protein